MQDSFFVVLVELATGLVQDIFFIDGRKSSWVGSGYLFCCFDRLSSWVLVQDIFFPIQTRVSEKLRASVDGFRLRLCNY